VPIHGHMRVRCVRHRVRTRLGVWEELCRGHGADGTAGRGAGGAKAYQHAKIECRWWEVSRFEGLEGSLHPVRPWKEIAVHIRLRKHQRVACSVSSRALVSSSASCPQKQERSDGPWSACRVSPAAHAQALFLVVVAFVPAI